MTNSNDSNRGETQAQRLEAALAEIEAMLAPAEVQQRLRQAPGENEWNVLQIVGHLIEMVPYWLGQSRGLMEASGEPPAFGRTLESPERIEGVERGARGTLDDLLPRLRDEVRSGAAGIRALTAADREKAGMHPRRGQMTVDDIVQSFIVEHLEDHVTQLKTALAA